MSQQPRTILQTLQNIEALLGGITELLVELLSQEATMAAEESAEARALNEATTALEAELADVTTVDGEVVTDLEGIKAAIGKVGPVTPEQVNAVTAVTSSLASLTAKLKAAGTAAADVEAGGGAPAPVPPAEQAPAPAAPAGSAAPAAGGGAAPA